MSKPPSPPLPTSSAETAKSYQSGDEKNFLKIWPAKEHNPRVGISPEAQIHTKML